MKKVICYVNQFFGGIGGEDKADQEPYIVEGVVGPTMAINAALKDAEVTHTVVCGDNFMGSNTEEALSRIMGFLEDKEMDLFIAGPAFQAGRYGVACGNVCKAVKEKFGVPVLTSMNGENPGADMFKISFSQASLTSDAKQKVISQEDAGTKYSLRTSERTQLLTVAFRCSRRKWQVSLIRQSSSSLRRISFLSHLQSS